MQIREQRPEDRLAVRRVNELAFGQAGEADLVEALHEAGAVLVALVAEIEGEIVGHIIFSSVTGDGLGDRTVAGLAPMAVHPDRQRSGIGSMLVRDGLERCRRLGLDGVVVLGHPEYYPRFGFVRASSLDLSCDYEVPDEVFLALEMSTGSLEGVSGVVHYHPSFATVE